MTGDDESTGGTGRTDEVITRVQRAGTHLAVIKGAWYPAPVPRLPDEDNVAFAKRLLHPTAGPYDHWRRRDCALGLHKVCRPRPKRSTRLPCECGCHRDTITGDVTSVPAEALVSLAHGYALPEVTARRVLGIALREQRQGWLRSLDDLRVGLRREYACHITEAFVIDVARMLGHTLTGPEAPVWRALADAANTRYELLGETAIPGPEPRSDEPEAAPMVPVVPLGPLLDGYRQRRDVVARHGAGWRCLVGGLLCVAGGVTCLGLGGTIALVVAVVLLVAGWGLLLWHAKGAGQRAEVAGWRELLIRAGVHPAVLDDDDQDDEQGQDDEQTGARR